MTRENYPGNIPSIVTHSEHAYTPVAENPLGTGASRRTQALTTLVFEIISNARCFFSVNSAKAASSR